MFWLCSWSCWPAQVVFFFLSIVSQYGTVSVSMETHGRALMTRILPLSSVSWFILLLHIDHFCVTESATSWCPINSQLLQKKKKKKVPVRLPVGSNSQCEGREGRHVIGQRAAVVVLCAAISEHGVLPHHATLGSPISQPPTTLWPPKNKHSWCLVHWLVKSALRRLVTEPWNIYCGT